MPPPPHPPTHLPHPAALAGEALASAPRERSYIMLKPDGVHRGLLPEAGDQGGGGGGLGGEGPRSRVLRPGSMHQSPPSPPPPPFRQVIKRFTDKGYKLVGCKVSIHGFSFPSFNDHTHQTLL